MRLSFLLFCSSVLALAYFYLFVNTEQTYILEIELLKLSSTAISFMIVVDKISLSFSFIVTLISGCVYMFACEYMKEDKFFWRFIFILLSFVISMNLLIFSGSLFFLLLGWDGLGISSFALIIYYQSQESLSGGFQTLMANRIGDSLIVASAFLLAFFGQFSYLYISNLMWGLVLVWTVAAMTKSAQYPFSSWLPAAMAAPTPVSALVHSSTLVTAGIYLVIRLCYNLELSNQAVVLLTLCGAVTCLLGGWAATYENDLKKIIALSTLSQLGIMMFCLGLGFPMLALFHLFTHALFKALLFLAAGCLLMSSFGTQDIRLLGSTSVSMPLVTVILNVTSLCLIGAPFLSAFYSKHLILELMVFGSTSMFAVLLMLVATMMTAKYVFRVLKAVNWSQANMPITSGSTPLKVDLSLMILAVGAIMGGNLFALMEINMQEIVVLPTIYSNLINFVTLLGIFLGISLSSQMNSHFMSTLFWLTPLFVFSPMIFSPVIKKISALDYGWLEPSIVQISRPSLLLSEIWNWPQSTKSFTRFLLGGIILFVGFSFIL